MAAFERIGAGALTPQTRLRPLYPVPDPMLTENQSTAKDEGHQRCALEGSNPLLESLGLRGDHGWILEGVSEH